MGEAGYQVRGSSVGWYEELLFVLPFLILVEILDVVFEDQKGWAILTMQFEAAFVIPFDNAVQFLAVLEHNHHGRVRIHLLLVIKALGVGLLRRDALALRRG